jgi:hypothetical protein
MSESPEPALAVFPSRARPRRLKLKRWHKLVLIFVVVFGVHASCPIIASSDSAYSIHLAHSIVTHGDFDLDEFQPFTLQPTDYRVVKAGEHYFNYFPYGVSLLAAPFVYGFGHAAQLLLGSAPGRFFLFPARIEKFIASIFMGVTAVFVFLAACRRTQEVYAWVMVFIFAFCTSAWSVGSRGLWQHGPSMMLLSMVLYLVLLGEEKPWAYALAALPLALSYVVRPTNSISVVAFAVFVALKLQRKRQWVWFALLGAAVFLAFLAINLATYRQILPPYYLPGRIGNIRGTFWEALAGNLISPARGLLIFTPVFLISAAAAIICIVRRQIDLLQALLWLVVVAHWLVISSFRPWWGGHSFGPRLFSDMVPFLVFLMIPFFPWFESNGWRLRIPLAALGVLLVSASFFVHSQGARSHPVDQWNTVPSNVDQNPQRVWDWHDLQFLRGHKS